MLPDHLVQLRHLCAPRPQRLHLGHSHLQGYLLVSCALQSSVSLQELPTQSPSAPVKTAQTRARHLQGFNSRDMFNKSAAVQAVIFFVLLILPGIVYGGVNWHSTSQRTHCVVRARLCCLCTNVCAH